MATPLLFTLSACNRLEMKEKLEPTTLSVQRTFVDVSCRSCHVTATPTNRNVSLIDISRVIETPGHSHGNGHQARMLIKAGCPKQSFFLSIMKEGKMPPPPAERVSAETLGIIENWIVSLKPGLKEEDCSDEPPE